MMKATPLLVGAMTCAIGAGTALGMSTPTEPVSVQTDPLATIPQHAIEARSREQARAIIAPQNHYAIETPEGRFEVSELAYRGRFRERMREQPYYGAQSEAEAFGMDRAHDRYEPETTHLGEVREEQRAMPANFVPLEEGIFENTAAPVAEAPVASVSVAPIRIAQADRPRHGSARIVRVEEALSRN